jgi:hypothetical protein
MILVGVAFGSYKRLIDRLSQGTTPRGEKARFVNLFQGEAKSFGSVPRSISAACHGFMIISSIDLITCMCTLPFFLSFFLSFFKKILFY